MVTDRVSASFDVHFLFSIMAFEWLCKPLLLITLDFFLGAISFCCQIAFLSTYVTWTNYDLAGAGIWTGIIFIATAVVVWSMDGKADRWVIAVGPCLSFVCAIILFSLNAAALDQLSQMCPIQSTSIVYHCSSEIGLDVVLMLCGLFAMPVNAVMVLIVFNLVKPN